MNFSKFISYLLHPLLMPTVALYILFQTDTFFKFSTTQELRNFVCLLVFVATFFIPLVISIGLYRSRQIASLEMESVSERIWPLLVTLVLYVGTLFMMRLIGLSFLIYTSFLAATITVFLVFLIYLLLKWKVSAHMAGIGGVIGAIIAFSLKLSTNMILALMLFVMAAGILGYARIKLKAHTPGQVYTGFFIGLSIQLILILS